MTPPIEIAIDDAVPDEAKPDEQKPEHDVTTTT